MALKVEKKKNGVLCFNPNILGPNKRSKEK
jgi:hypothetical protein